jgi:hypothetical protein
MGDPIKFSTREEQARRLGLDPTVVSPAAKSISGGFSGGSGQGRGRTFDKKRVSSKVAVPASRQPRI